MNNSLSETINEKIPGLDDLSRPFIHSWQGCTIYFLSTLIILISFMSLTDRAEVILSRGSSNSGAETGIVVEGAGRFPFPLTPEPYILILVLAAITTLLAIVTLLIWNKYATITATPILFGAILYTDLTIIEYGIRLEPPATLIENPIRLGGVLLLTLFVFMLTWRFSYSINPREISSVDRPIVYLTNQWRQAQAAFSSGFAIVIGGSIPYMLQHSEIFGTYALTSTYGFLLTPVLSITVFYLIRLEMLERELQKTS